MNAARSWSTVYAMNIITQNWWAKHRLMYNIFLVVAGVSAFACMVLIGETFCQADSGYEITVFTIGFQAIGYLMAMVLANVLYGLGSLLERAVNPQYLQPYRKCAFALGTAFSVALPFLVPALLFVKCRLFPAL
jgi:hypothetical protein